MTVERLDLDHPDDAFSAALRSAISDSGLSLDRVQARLQSRGVSVSVTALSYWQSGKRQPERQSSISAVRSLEDILGLDPGALLGLLPPPRPRGVTGRRPRKRTSQRDRTLRAALARFGEPDVGSQLALIGLHDQCVVDAHGGHRVTARALPRSTVDGQARWPLVYDHGHNAPLLSALRNCRIGETEVHADVGFTVAELVFDRPVEKGDTQLVEYEIDQPQPDRAAHFREFRATVHEYLVEVVHAGEPGTRSYWQYSTAKPGRRELTVDDAGAVHAVALDFGPGVFGIEWSDDLPS